MQTLRRLSVARVLTAITATSILCACAGKIGNSTSNQISVYLPVSTVEVTQGAKSVSIPIQIDSSSETALVAVFGLPAGVQVTYAASDTNPSGTLTFSASASAIPGNYMPTVSVISSGLTASTGFTLVVAPS